MQNMNRTDENVNQYLEGIYNTVIVKDIEERQARKGCRKTQNHGYYTTEDYCTISGKCNR